MPTKTPGKKSAKKKPAAKAKPAASRPKAKKSPAAADLDSHSILREAAAKVGDTEMSAVLQDAGKIEDMAKRGPLASFLHDVRDLLAMVRDYTTGHFRKIPFGSIAAIVGALFYMLSPVDLIPDFIPGMGFVDDAGVLAACLQLVKFDLQNYRKLKGLSKTSGRTQPRSP